MECSGRKWRREYPCGLGAYQNSKRRRDDATADELRAEIMKRLAVLTSAGLIDAQALPAPKRKIAN
jgi:hypothetical protein